MTVNDWVFGLAMIDVYIQVMIEKDQPENVAKAREFRKRWLKLEERTELYG